MVQDTSAKYWILPIIQGHFEVERCSVDVLDGLSFAVNQSEENEDSSSDEEDGFTTVKDFRTGENLKPDEYDIVLISRRSRHRAGKQQRLKQVWISRSLDLSISRSLSRSLDLSPSRSLDLSPSRSLDLSLDL